MDRQRQAQKKAEEVLEQNFQTTPPVDLRTVVSNYGGLTIKEADLGEMGKDVAGFIDMDTRTIYVNASDPPNRKTFTIAHELGHWLLHQHELESDPDKYAIYYRTPLGGYVDDVERAANTFAANLLVPRKMLEKYLRLGLDKITLAKIFGVSEEVIGYRISNEFPEYANRV